LQGKKNIGKLLLGKNLNVNTKRLFNEQIPAEWNFFVLGGCDRKQVIALPLTDMLNSTINRSYSDYKISARISD